MPVVSYYSRRSARDPGWREAQVVAASERRRRRRQADPEACRLAHREAMRRYREKRRHGLTFDELLGRCRQAAGTTASAIGDPDVLRLVLADEVRRGRVDLAAGRYRLNGLPYDVKAALRDLEL
jgi:hypothetical protein